MTPRSASTFALAAGVLGLTLALAGCSERRGAVIEDRLASAIPLAPQAVLHLETRNADVHLIQSPDDTVRVVTYRRVQSTSQESARNIFDQIKVTMEREGDRLSIRVREPDRRRHKINVQAGPWRIRRSIEIELTVAVPANARLECETATGDFDAVGLAQDVSFSTNSGDLEVSQGTGRTTVRATSGDIILRDLGGFVNVQTTSGDVDAVNLGRGLVVRATSGDVHAARILGGVSIETSTGDIESDEIAGPVSYSTSAGDVIVAATTDSCTIETASGDVEARLAGRPRHVRVRTSSGQVELALPANVGGDLDVQTSSGAIAVRAGVDVDIMNRNRLTGRLGGPGTVAVRTSSGDITIRTNGATP